MKIAVSAKDSTKDSILDVRFGRCEYFQIYDTQSNTIESTKNNGVSASGGAGIAAATQVIEQDVEVLITGHLGPNAFELLDRANIKAYSCDEIPVMEAIDKYNNKQLSLITSAGKSHAGI